MIRFKGDFAKLDRWAKQIARAPEALHAAARNMADESLALVAEGFRTEIAPDGKPWKGVARAGKVLQDSGRGRASWHRKQVGRAGFRIAAAAKHMAFHQNGTKNMAARKQVPDGGKLPPKWKAAMVEAAEDALAAQFKGGGKRR
jgi:phage gpG-like protein